MYRTSIHNMHTDTQLHSSSQGKLINLTNPSLVCLYGISCSPPLVGSQNKWVVVDILLKWMVHNTLQRDEADSLALQLN